MLHSLTCSSLRAFPVHRVHAHACITPDMHTTRSLVRPYPETMITRRAIERSGMRSRAPRTEECTRSPHTYAHDAPHVRHVRTPRRTGVQRSRAPVLPHLHTLRIPPAPFHSPSKSDIPTALHHWPGTTGDAYTLSEFRVSAGQQHDHCKLRHSGHSL